MKHFFWFNCLFMFVFVLNAQDKEGAEKLVSEGIKYHDRGKYEDALELYEKALKLDSHNLYALAEKSMTLLSIKEYKKSIEAGEKAIEKHPGNTELKYVYVTIGNAYYALKESQKSIDLYNQGIKLAPDFYQLHFNKGITLSGQKEHDDALKCFERSVTCNPKHPGSHNAIARTLEVQNKKIPALLAYVRFMIVEPTSGRAAQNFQRIRVLMEGGATKTDKNKINITINASSLGDTLPDGSNADNNFTTQELILALSGALSMSDGKKKKKPKSEVETFISNFGSLCSSLEESRTKNRGFYWEFYADYFIALHNKKLTETLGYIVYAKSGDEKVSDWIKKNEKKINDFFEWSAGYEWPKF